MILKIFNQFIPFRKLAFILLEGLFLLGLVFSSAAIPFPWGNSTYFDPGELFLKSLLIALVVQLCLYYFDLYDLKIFKKNLELVIRLLQSLGVAMIILALVYYLFPEIVLERRVFLVSLFLTSAIIIFWRLFYNYLVMTNNLDQKVIMVGCGNLAQKIVEIIKAQEDSGFMVEGFICENPNRVGDQLLGIPIIGHHGQIKEIVRKEKIERIIVALDERRGRFPDDQLLECKLKGISVEDGVKFYENLTGRLQVEDLTPSFLIFSDGFKKSKLILAMKRVTEITLSLVGLVLSFPLLLIVAILIKLESRGPVFYRQERVGENGKVFRLLKFRSMIENAETNGPVWATDNDPRTTRVGRWIRKWRLDEIPQMINVLKGDMSIVGPRPERPSFVTKLGEEIPFYNLRATLRPGITGWAQIRYPYGASQEDALEKLKYDLYYIKNLSFLFDLVIIFESVKVMLFGKGAR